MTSVVNRYYDPSTDQFLSIDPDVASTNQPYVFTNDDPLNFEDPLGMEALKSVVLQEDAAAKRCKDNPKANGCRGIDVVGDIVKVGKSVLNNSVVRGIATGVAITIVCAGTEGIGCALIAGGVTGGGLGLLNHSVNKTSGDWQGAVAIGGLQGMTNALTGGIWSELSGGEASSAFQFFSRSVPGTILVFGVLKYLTIGR